MSPIVAKKSGSLVARAADLGGMAEDDLHRYAAESARDRDVESLWALTEAHLTLHGAAGAHVSAHTLAAYRYGVMALLETWQGENLLRPSRNAGVIWVRRLEEVKDESGDAQYSASTVRSRLTGAKALYAALRWSGATETNPFENVRPARNLTAAWEKREARVS